MTADNITHDEMMAILRRLENNQNNIKAGQRVLSEQFEKYQEAQPDAKQFRSYAKEFGGYGAKNIKDKLGTRGDKISAASQRKANGYWRTTGKPVPALSDF